MGLQDSNYVNVPQPTDNTILGRKWTLWGPHSRGAQWCYSASNPGFRGSDAQVCILIKLQHISSQHSTTFVFLK